MADCSMLKNLQLTSTSDFAVAAISMYLFVLKKLWNATNEMSRRTSVVTAAASKCSGIARDRATISIMSTCVLVTELGAYSGAKRYASAIKGWILFFRNKTKATMSLTWISIVWSIKSLPTRLRKGWQLQ